MVRRGNFYPRSPCGERPVSAIITPQIRRFLSTLSLRRATILENILYVVREFLSTLSLRRATVAEDLKATIQSIFLSTLSLRRATMEPCAESTGRGYFYPRSPCGERPKFDSVSDNPALFLSTLSLRRATDQASASAAAANISIHALLAESDLAGPSGPAFLFNFYPRSPCGERRIISIVLFTPPIFLSTLSLRRAT